jgi:hypothetical protein
MDTARYSIPDHVYLYLDEACAVWLDVRKDEYIGQPREALRGLRGWIKDWPADPPDENPVADPAGALVELEKRGLITSGDGAKGAIAVKISEPKFDFVDETENFRVGPRQILSALLAYRRAKRALSSLEGAISRLRSLKQSANPRPDVNVADLRSHMKAFMRLRRGIYDVKQNCLLDAMCAVEYLASLGFRSNFVIGVQIQPFTAHAWAQSGEYVLNDYAIRVGYYSPILVI